MPKLDCEMKDHVAVVTMNQGENRFNFDFLDAFNQVLDEIEQRAEISVLVVKSAHEKIWSNGIDLQWLLPAITQDLEMGNLFSVRLLAFFRRLLMLPLTTIAAINGHAFAGGAVLACAFDFRFMRTDRGYFCFPEVDMQLPFWPSMEAIIQKAMPGHLALESQLTGKRYTAQELEVFQVVKKASHGNALMDEVMAFAQTQNKARGILKTMKGVSFSNIIRIMDHDDPPFIETVRKLFEQMMGK